MQTAKQLKVQYDVSVVTSLIINGWIQETMNTFCNFTKVLKIPVCHMIIEDDLWK